MASGELALFLQALGHAGLNKRAGRDPLEHIVVPFDQLPQLRPNVGLRELWRHPVGVYDQARRRTQATKRDSLLLTWNSPERREKEKKERERMMGFEPTTFCMASRRSSQLSYIRVARPV